MNRRLTALWGPRRGAVAWGLAVVAVCVVCASAEAPATRQRSAGGQRQPFARAITDKDVQPFDLVVHWKALCVLGEHAQPTGIYVCEQEIFTTDDHTRLSCYDPADGKRRWLRVLGEPRQPIFPPAVDHEDAFVVAAGYLIALGRQLGNERWRVRLKNPPGGGPAVADKYVYVGSADGWLRAYDRNEQKEAWYFNARAPLVGHPVTVGTEGQSLVFVADQKKRIYCLSHMERRIIWEDETAEAVMAPPARVGRHLYLPCSDFNVYAIDALAATADERLTWVFRSGSQVLQSPAAVGATVYFPSFRNGFYAVRRLDGKQRWWRETGMRLLSVGKRRCYILDNDHGILVCDKLTGRLVGRYVPPEDYRWLATNIHTDAIYLVNRDGLIVCLREREAVEPEEASASTD